MIGIRAVAGQKPHGSRTAAEFSRHACINKSVSCEFSTHVGEAARRVCWHVRCTVCSVRRVCSQMSSAPAEPACLRYKPLNYKPLNCKLLHAPVASDRFRASDNCACAQAWRTMTSG